MKLTEEQMATLLASAMPSMVEGFKKDISASVEWNVRDAAGKQITAYVTEWIKTNVLPDVEKSLIEGKDGLIQVGIQFGQQSVGFIVEVMTKALSEQLQSSWNRKKLFEAMFG